MTITTTLKDAINKSSNFRYVNNANGDGWDISSADALECLDDSELSSSVTFEEFSASDTANTSTYFRAKYTDGCGTLYLFLDKARI